MFLNPNFLYALPLGLIPIIIYYLMRYRSLKVVWGANYVLERALERLKKQLYLDQIILLALRTLVCLGLVLLFARPVAKQQDSVVSSTGTHRVIILDGSYSMQAGETGNTRWDRSIEALKELVKTWGRGEKWSLLLIGTEPEWIVDSAIVETPEASLESIRSLETSESSASLGKALEVAASKFANDSVELYLFVDDQASTWEGVGESAIPKEWNPSIYWMLPTLDSRDNIAVTSVRFASERVLMHHPCRLFVSARNFSPQPVKDSEIQIHMDGAFSGRETISLLPGQEGTIHIDLNFDEPGPHHVTARLKTDVLNFDNAMSAGIQVDKEMRVGVLRASASQKKFDSAWGFLQIAGRIEKMEDGDSGPLFTMGQIQFMLIEGSPTPAKLNQFDAVIFDGGSALNAEDAMSLSDFVKQGGGLVLVPDETVNITEWNDLFGKMKLLPARLRKPVIEKLGGTRFKTVSRSSFGDPSFKTFETEEDGDLSQARFYSWIEFEEPEAGTTTLAQFADRQPFLLRQSRSLGRGLLLAAGLNGRGNSLIVREFFFPFVFRLFGEAAAGGIYPRTLKPNEAIGLRLKDMSPRGVSLTVEGRDPKPLTPQKVGNEMHVIAAQGAPATGLASFLLLNSDGSNRVYYGIQGLRMDSDLAAVPSDQEKRLTAKLKLMKVTNWQELDALLQRSGQEWHHWMAIGVLVCLVGAGLMEWRFV
ncbi:MAG: BatA and WFA domain-containing protein [Planctomycetota bacterium]|nr:BatA and WFA domain-containing protein [Planctomycetota bacterium]